MASVTNQSSPAISGAPVTPTNATPLTKGTCRSLYIGVSGTVVGILANDTVASTFVGVNGGSILPFMFSTVEATGTTATSIVALY